MVYTECFDGQRGEAVMGDVKTCGVCCGDISDRYIMRVADTSYHERCLLCAICGIRLAHTCFARDSKLLCRHDYDRLYAKKCLGCSERISADELVMKALDNIFHLRCFVCVVCGGRLQRGDQFVIKQGQLFCRPDYEKEVEMLQGYAQGEFSCDEMMTSSRTQDGRRGPKRPRTILTTQQRRAFKASFEVSPKPCRKVREALGKDTGLSVRIVQGPKRQHTMLTGEQREVFKQYFEICPKPGCKVREGLARETGLSSRIVQVWFQNQRAKMKKIQKKARQAGSKDSDSGDEKKTKFKEEDSPNCRNLNEDSDTNASSLPTGETFLHAGSDDPSQFLPIKQEVIDNEHGGFFKIAHGEHHHTSRDYNRTNSEKIETGFLGFPFVGSVLEQAHGLCHTPTPGMGLNPIDRLYSMQTSYFCSEENPLVDQ